jgi:aspartate/methionine/tyrosine aminotransferase
VASDSPGLHAAGLQRYVSVYSFVFEIQFILRQGNAMKLEAFKLERYFARYEFTAPYLLCTSDCESMTLDELLALEPGARERFGDLWLGYTESLGDPALREAIASLYTNIDSDQVLVHSGAEEAIFNFMNVALSPGDHIIVHAPYYQSLGTVAQGIGARVTLWQGDPDNGWALDLETLEGLVTPQTRVVVLNVPHNPTGYLSTEKFLRELSRMSDAHGFVVFSDEVYRGLELDPADRLPAFADIDARGISLGVMSKTYGLAGLRIGWIATRNREIFEEMAAFKDYTSICSSAPSEFLSTLALRHATSIGERNLGIIRHNLDLLDDFFAEHRELFAWSRPRAGSIAFPELLQGNIDVLCADLVEKAGVLLVPGTMYGEGYNHFRVGFGRKNFGEGLERFHDYLVGK